MGLSDQLVAVLRAPSPCFITTLMADGSPQITEVWVDTTASTSSSTRGRAR